MAPRKTTSRKKRSTRSKNSGNSVAATLTVGAILIFGATALWATSQGKSPSSSVTALLSNAAGSGSKAGSGSGAAASHDKKQIQNRPHNTAPARSQVQKTPQQAQAAPAPLRRPPLNIGQSQGAENKISEKQLAMAAPQPALRIVPKPMQQPAAKADASHAAPLPPPAGKSATDNSRYANGAFKIPKVIIAKQALTIRETAWDKAKSAGTVEKGREMRSYAKVGRWHRVVVPSTNIIGWVQEDQLIFKNQLNGVVPARSASARNAPFTTGSVNKHPANKQPASKQSVSRHSSALPAQTTGKPRNSGLVAPVYPQQPVAKK